LKDITIRNGVMELSIFEKDLDAWVSSRTIAEIFEKRHKDVLEKINEILKIKNDFVEKNFRLSSYKDTSGKDNKEYLLNRKSFALIVMGFTGKKAQRFILNYIFNAELLYEESKVFTYFILNPMNNLIKIGRTKNIDDRLSTLEKMNGCTLKLLLIINNNCEKEMHIKFKKYRKFGEWFIYSQEIKNFIDSHAIKNFKTL
jgi:Rha family phage regulatory protein